MDLRSFVLRICVRFYPESGKFDIPTHYNHLIQGFVYRNLDEAMAEKYHTNGFRLGKRVYKLFTFSRLKADRLEFVKESKSLRLYGMVSLKIGALDPDLLESFALHLLKKGVVRLGNSFCRLHSIEVEKPIEVKGPVVVKALSPITVHRTFYNEEGKRRTVYYSPWDREFSELVGENLLRKAKLVYGPDYSFKFEEPVMVPVKVSQRSQKIILYKDGYVIKGWLGVYRLNLPEPLFNIAYYAGLGARNSMGFGMVEVVNG